MAPRFRIEVLEARPEGDLPGRWRVGWLVHNDEDTPLELTSAWLPHGRFRGDGHVPLAVSVPGGDAVRIELAVTAVEAPGEVVNNAFLVVQTSGAGSPQRVFTRMRIEFDAHGRPRPIIEVVTCQSLQ